MTQFMTVLLILYGLTVLFVSVTSRLEACVRMIGLQGLIFSAMILAGDIPTGHFHLVVPLTETLLVKTILVPAILLGAIRRYGVYRENAPFRPNFFLLASTLAAFILAFLLASLAQRAGSGAAFLGFAISLAAMASGLMVIVFRKKILSHILGYILFENSIFLLSLVLGIRIPLVVHLGVLLDVFTAVFLLVVIYNRIKGAFTEVTIDHLSSLKD